MGKSAFVALGSNSQFPSTSLPPNHSITLTTLGKQPSYSSIWPSKSHIGRGVFSPGPPLPSRIPTKAKSANARTIFVYADIGNTAPCLGQGDPPPSISSTGTSNQITRKRSTRARNLGCGRRRLTATPGGLVVALLRVVLLVAWGPAEVTHVSAVLGHLIFKVSQCSLLR